MSKITQYKFSSAVANAGLRLKSLQEEISQVFHSNIPTEGIKIEDEPVVYLNGHTYNVSKVFPTTCIMYDTAGNETFDLDVLSANDLMGILEQIDKEII